MVLLQHPREARNPIGTARMAHLSVEGSQLVAGVDFSEDEPLRRLAEQPGERAVVLYPSKESRDARELAQVPCPLTVFVIDGTWWQAEKIWKSNPWLQRLPAYRLAPQSPSRYDQIRSEPEAHCLSTIEAVAALLDAVAGESGRHAAMLRPLDSLIGRQLGFSAGAGRDPRRRLRTRPARPFLLPEPLASASERALLFFGEGNGYPANAADAPPTEMAQWLAVRPATGETFHALVRPTAPLSPTFLSNQQLAPELLEQMIDPAELLRRWAAFVRPDDLWCGWGHFAAGLMARAGGAAPEHVDLQKACAARLHAPAGAIDRAAEAMGLPQPAPRFPGRGGRRLARLSAVFESLLSAHGRPFVERSPD